MFQLLMQVLDQPFLWVVVTIQIVAIHPISLALSFALSPFIQHVDSCSADLESADIVSVIASRIKTFEALLKSWSIVCFCVAAAAAAIAHLTPGWTVLHWLITAVSFPINLFLVRNITNDSALDSMGDAGWASHVSSLAELGRTLVA